MPQWFRRGLLPERFADAEVVAQQAVRRSFVMRRYGIEDTPVIGYDGSLDFGVHHNDGTTVAVRTDQNAGHCRVQAGERVGFGRPNQCGMKLEVRETALDGVVNRGLDLLEGMPETFKIEGCGALAGKTHSLAFDGDSRLHYVFDYALLLRERVGEEIAKHRYIRLTNDCANATLDLDRAHH